MNDVRETVTSAVPVRAIRLGSSGRL